MTIKFEDGGADIRDLLPQEVSDRLRSDQANFLSAYLMCANISEAARMVGVGRNRFWGWQKEFPAFKEALFIIEPLVTEVLAEALHERGFCGVKRYKFTRDGLPIMWTPPGKAEEEHYYELEWSDQLLLRLLEARDPKKYSAKVKQDHSGELHVTRVVLDRGRGESPEGDPKG